MQNIKSAFVQLSARTFSLANNIEDPYILFHTNAEQLSDERIGELFSQWRSANDEPENEEEFEKFLDWLNYQHGFFQIGTINDMFHF